MRDDVNKVGKRRKGRRKNNCGKVEGIGEGERREIEVYRGEVRKEEMRPKI